MQSTSATLRRPSGSGAEAFGSLQILRGAAAWLVVYHHYMQGFHDFKYSTPIGHFFTVVGPFGVDVFFVISGFIMFWTLAHRHYSAREFLSRRVLRIAPVYWLMTLVFILVVRVLPSALASRFDWNSFSLMLSMLFVPHQNPSGIGVFPVLTVGWTLNFEMFFYIWLSLMLLVSGRHWFVACAASMMALPLVWSAGWPYASILSSGLLYEFIIGMSVAYLYQRTRTGMRSKADLLGWTLLILGVCSYWTHSSHHPIVDLSSMPILWRFGNVNITLLASAALFLAAALAFESHVSRRVVSRLFLRLGDLSYSTYLVHPIALVIAFHFLGEPQSWYAESLDLGAYTAVTMILSYLSYRWIETGPAMNYLKRSLLPLHSEDRMLGKRVA